MRKNFYSNVSSQYKIIAVDDEEGNSRFFKSVFV